MNSLKCPNCNLARLTEIFTCRKCGFDFSNRLAIQNDSNRQFLAEFIKLLLKPENTEKLFIQIAKFCSPVRLTYIDDFFDTVYIFSDEEMAKKEQAKILKIMFMNAVKDGYISNEEFDLINKFYAESVLTEMEFKNISETIFKGCVQLALSNRTNPLSERQALEHLAERLNISQELQDWMRKKVNYFATAKNDENVFDK